MRADRAAAGLSGTAILVVIALAPGDPAGLEVALLAIAGVVVVATFAPALPQLHRLPIVGAPRIEVIITFADKPLRMQIVPSLRPDPEVLRVGFVNAGPRRVDGALVNVLVDAPMTLTACDHAGKSIDRGYSMPDTVIDGRPMRFWAEKNATLPVGATLLHYRLAFPKRPPSEGFTVRVAFSSDDLYGREAQVAEAHVEVDTLRPGQ